MKTFLSPQNQKEERWWRKRQWKKKK